MKMHYSSKLFALLACAFTATAAQAAEFEDYARVVSVAPQVEQVNQPRQQCWTEYVQAQPQYQQQPRSAGGAIIGGIAGGLLGSQVGGGNGRIAAAAVGAMTGAVVGDRMDNNNAHAAVPVGQQPVQQCRMVDQWTTRNNGFLVTYEYRGNTYSSVMPYDPGRRLRLRVSATPLM